MVCLALFGVFIHVCGSYQVYTMPVMDMIEMQVKTSSSKPPLFFPPHPPPFFPSNPCLENCIALWECPSSDMSFPDILDSLLLFLLLFLMCKKLAIQKLLCCLATVLYKIGMKWWYPQLCQPLHSFPGYCYLKWLCFGIAAAEHNALPDKQIWFIRRTWIKTWNPFSPTGQCSAACTRGGHLKNNISCSLVSF